MAFVYLDSSVSYPGALRGPGDEQVNRLPIADAAPACVG